MSNPKESSFLDGLFEAKATVLKIGQETDKNVKAILREVDRQIEEALKGDLITGKGVTKSGRED